LHFCSLIAPKKGEGGIKGPCECPMTFAEGPPVEFPSSARGDGGSTPFKIRKSPKFKLGGVVLEFEEGFGTG